MPVTTVLSDEGTATIVSDNDNGSFFQHRFSWSAAFAGALLATAVTFFLLALGAGFGLALVHPQTTTQPTFLTLGAIYFLAAQAFGFAAGGHLAGRLIGPAPETAKEEEFRSAAHGLVVWALAVVATATMVAIGTFAVGSSAVTVAAASSRPNAAAQTSAFTPDYVAYWVDMLFRPAPNPSQASLDGVQFAQAYGGNATDATSIDNQPAPNPAATPSPDINEESGTSGAPRQNLPSGPPPSTPPAPSTTLESGAQTSTPSHLSPQDTMIPAGTAGFTAPASITTDKAEVTRIINVGMMNGARLNQYDKDRISTLVAQDAGLSLPTAQRRVDNAETRIHDDELKAAETARKAASYASLWIALSLLFGAIVATMAAVSARWEDDRVTFGFARRAPE
jgi:hypothetical protein